MRCDCTGKWTQLKTINISKCRMTYLQLSLYWCKYQSTHLWIMFFVTWNLEQGCVNIFWVKHSTYKLSCLFTVISNSVYILVWILYTSEILNKFAHQGYKLQHIYLDDLQPRSLYTTKQSRKKLVKKVKCDTVEKESEC